MIKCATNSMNRPKKRNNIQNKNSIRETNFMKQGSEKEKDKFTVSLEHEVNFHAITILSSFVEPC